MRLSGAAALMLAVPATAQTWDGDLRPAVTIAGHERERFTLAQRMAHWRVRGVSVAVIDDCRIVEVRGVGTATAVGVPVTPGTLFQAASISKPVAAVAALRLAEQGRVPLDSDVRSALRRWTLPGDAPVTLRALLGHAAGVGVASFPGYPAGSPVPALAQILNGAPPANTSAVRVEASAGTWRYSGGGYEIVQAVLEDTTGEPFASLAERLVLSPVGMADSAFDQPIAGDRAARAATGFSDAGVSLRGGWRTYPELAAAGLWSTPGDLARFAIALARAERGDDETLLSHESASAMLTRGPGSWGLGIALGGERAARWFGHSGANAGFTSDLILYPDPCRGAVVMTNGDDARGLIAEVMRALGDAYAWPERREPDIRAVVPMTAAITRRFVGTWRLRGAAERFVIARGPRGLTWARLGQGTRDLVAGSGGRVFSPDMPLTLTAMGTRLAVNFEGRENTAVRLR